MLTQKRGDPGNHPLEVFPGVPAAAQCVARRLPFLNVKQPATRGRPIRPCRCWTIQQRYFPAAAGIVDWYHVSEHVWDCGKVLQTGSGPVKARGDEALTHLHDSGGRGLVQWLRTLLKPLRKTKRAAVQSLLDYL